MKTLVVVPTPETVARLQQIFTSSPFTVDWSTLLVPVAHLTSESNVTPVDQVYSAKFKNFHVLFDHFRQTAELVGVLDCPELLKRAIDCGMQYDFILKLIFLPYSPAQSQSVRHFTVSVADTLVSKEDHPFTFQKEFILEG